jgi:hypothetical protein
MHKILLLFILQFAFNIAQAQDPAPTMKVLATVNIESRFAEIDRMQQLYVVTDDHTLQKYDNKGILVKTFNENGLGILTSVDVSNPFQPLLYFEEYQTVVVLDRSLSELYRFNLNDLGYVQVDAVGISSDNQVWLYDANNFMLKKIDSRGAIQKEGPDLSATLRDDFLPRKLIEQEYNIFVNDPDYGILLFDLFGNYQRTIKILGLEYFQVMHQQIVWMDMDATLHRFHLYSLQEVETDLSALGLATKNLEQACWAAERLCLRYTDRIVWYEFL